MTTDPVRALLRDHPDRLDAEAAASWVAARRALLVARSTGRDDLSGAVSSGCAARGARNHADDLAADATGALTRLDAGLGTRCEVCDAVLPFARLDAAPAAVRCTGCVRVYVPDTRWCR